MDELRVTKGLARYGSANFTPQADVVVDNATGTLISTANTALTSLFPEGPISRFTSRLQPVDAITPSRLDRTSLEQMFTKMSLSNL